MKNLELINFTTPDDLARTVAAKWLDEIKRLNRPNEPCCVALSGGRIAQNFFSAVAEQAKARKIGAKGVPSFPGFIHFFWADERCVAPDDKESNFRVANELLFAPLKISETQIHRIRGELPPEAAAAQAVSELCRVAPANANRQPVFDLIFLGMGEDGHVASLFPGNLPTDVSDQAVYHTVKNSPKPPPNRITLGYAPIAAARQVWVLVSGAGKESALREALRADGRTPLARVAKIRTQTAIFSDLLTI